MTKPAKQTYEKLIGQMIEGNKNAIITGANSSEPILNLSSVV